MESVPLHLAVSFVDGPAVSCHSVDGHEQSGAVGSVKAVNEDGVILVVVENGQKAIDDIRRRHVPVIEGHAYEGHSF